MNNISLGFFFAYLFGLVMVMASSTEAFNQPSYPTEKKKYYTKVKPKFITLKTKYREALMFYLFVMVLLFTAISFSPVFAKALLPENAQKSVIDPVAGSPALPLLAASLLMGFQNAFYIKEFEKRFRWLLHRWAKIPYGARDTIDRLKTTKFDFSKYNKTEIVIQEEFVNVEKEDFKASFSSIERKWAKICCLVFSFRMAKECTIDELRPVFSNCYGSDFFEEYSPEYDEIKTMHRSLAYAVSDAKKKNADTSTNKIIIAPFSQTLHKDLNDLLDRIYTFIACAVRSTKSTDSEVEANLRQLGFVLTAEKEKTALLRPIIITSGFIAIIVIASVTVSQILFPMFLNKELFKDIPYIPRNITHVLLWAISAIIYLGVSASTALSYRRCSRRHNKWKSPDHENASRPISKYLGAAIIGGFTGYLVIIFLGTMKILTYYIMNGVTDFKGTFFSMALNNLVWILVSGATAWFTVYHYDTFFSEDSKEKFSKEAVIQAAVMAILGFLAAFVYTEIWDELNRLQNQQLDPQSYNLIKVGFSGLAAVILMFVGGFMGYFFPKNKRDSRFKTVKIISSYNNTALPQGLPVLEQGQEIGKTGEWLRLFSRDHILSVVSDELGTSNPVMVNPNISSEGKIKLPCTFEDAVRPR